MARELAKAPVQVREKYEFWKNVIRFDGPLGLRRIRGFNDEALAGAWKGFRSSRLSREDRIIYKVEGDVCQVLVERVSAHDYRR